jgi:chemotaxis protein methyltransferase CheR
VDVIFCRNVIIYFDRPTQERILQKLANLPVPGGYVRRPFRDLHDMDLPLVAGGAGALQERKCGA